MTNNDSGLPRIGSDNSHKLTIMNGNTRRDSDDKFRLLYIAAGADVTLDNLWLSNGYNLGISNAGCAIYSETQLAIEDSTIQGNRAEGDK